MAPAPTLTLTRFASISGSNPQVISGPIDEVFSTYFASPNVAEQDTDQAKKANWMYSGAMYRPGAQRDDDNVIGFSAIVLDIDCKAVPPGFEHLALDPMYPEEWIYDDWAQLFCIVHHTWSSTPDNPCWRLIVPLNRPLLLADCADATEFRARYAQLWLTAVHMLTGASAEKTPQIDASASTLSISFFAPSVPVSRADTFDAPLVNIPKSGGGPLAVDAPAVVPLEKALATLAAVRKASKSHATEVKRAWVAHYAPAGATATATPAAPAAPDNVIPFQQPDSTGLVIEGNRNNYAYQAAKDALRGSANRDIAWNHLCTINQGMVPPLELAELTLVFASAEKAVIEELQEENPLALTQQAQKVADSLGVQVDSTDQHGARYSGAALLDLPLRPEAERWIWPGYFPRGKVTGMFGMGGTGKSMFMLNFAVNMACSMPQIDGNMATPAGRTLYVSCEDDHEVIAERAQAIGQAMKVPPAMLSDTITVWDRTGCPNSLMEWSSRASSGARTEFFLQLYQLLQAERYDLVIFDTRDDVYAGNENDNTQIRQFITRTLAPLAKVGDCAVVFLAHISMSGSKKDGGAASGGRAWVNTPRAQIALQKTGKGPDIKLSVEKTNHGHKPPPLRIFLNYPLFSHSPTEPENIGDEVPAMFSEPQNNRTNLLQLTVDYLTTIFTNSDVSITYLMNDGWKHSQRRAAEGETVKYLPAELALHHQYDESLPLDQRGLYKQKDFLFALQRLLEAGTLVYIRSRLRTPSGQHRRQPGIVMFNQWGWITEEDAIVDAGAKPLKPQPAIPGAPG